MSSAETVLRLSGVARRYGDLVVVENIDFSLAAGETAALLGPSGSGKSSLLHIAGLLEAASSGEVEILGRRTSGLNDAERTRIRRDTLGFVYQFHHLLPEFTALGNVALPQLIGGVKKAEAEGEAKRLLTALGLGERLHHQPGQLSGGEQQRTAIARALANKPKILLADEPTGNLDSATGAAIVDALFGLQERHGATLVLVTHAPDLAERCDQVVEIEDGRARQRAGAAAA